MFASSAKRNRSELLKAIGIFSMLLDHVGIIFFPQAAILRMVGRLALPIFAFGISQGFIHSSDFKKYYLRILAFAFIAQAPFMLAINANQLNILFTFAIGLAALFFLQKKNYFITAALVVLSSVVPMDYGAYGTLSILVFHCFNKRSIQLAFFMILTIAYSIFVQWEIQLFAVGGALIVLYFPARMFKLKLPKFFFYWFYPAHLAILFLIKMLIS